MQVVGQTRRPPSGEASKSADSKMHLDATEPLLPFIAVATGVFRMIAPRVLSFAMAVYLIFACPLGLDGIYHIIK
jgi:hypothetical protein